MGSIRGCPEGLYIGLKDLEDSHTVDEINPKQPPGM